MATITKGPALGDIVLYETPLAVCREEYEVTRVLAATLPLEVGTPMDFDAAVAAVQTYTTNGGFVADGGTYRLGYDGYWTTPLAWNANIAAINTALDVMIVLSGGTAGDIVTANVGGDLHISTNTFTFLNTLGNVPEIQQDYRLLTDGGVAYNGLSTMLTTTVGELATMKMISAAAANTDAILLERVSLEDLQNASGEKLRRAFLMRGHAVVNATEIAKQGTRQTAAFGTAVQTQTALVAIGIQARLEPIATSEGTPSV